MNRGLLRNASGAHCCAPSISALEIDGTEASESQMGNRFEENTAFIKKRIE